MRQTTHLCRCLVWYRPTRLRALPLAPPEDKILKGAKPAESGTRPGGFMQLTPPGV